MRNKNLLFLIPIFCASFLVGCGSGGSDPIPTSTTYNFIYYNGHSIDVEVPEGKDVKDYYPENTPKHDDGYTEYTYTWEYKQNYKYQEKQNSIDISTTYYFEYADTSIPTAIVKVPKGGDVEEYYPTEHSPDHYEYNVDTGVRRSYIGWTLKEGNTYKETFVDTNIYKVTYHLQDGASHENEEWLDEAIPYELKQADALGYTFLGWFDNATAGNKVTILNLTAPTEIWARFEIINYTITYLPAGVEHSNPLTYTVNDEITLSPASKNGYTFNNWTDNKGTPVEKIKKGSTGAITLTANFTITKYTITYHNTDGETFGNPTEYYVTTDTFSLNEARKTGYDFGGWFKNESFTGDPVTQIAKGTTGNLDLYAKLPAHEYSITYYPNGGTNPGDNPTTYTIESTKELSEATKYESVFGGWYKESTFVNKITSLNGLHEDLNLYAKFTDNSYSITYDGDVGTSNPNPNEYTYYQDIVFNSASKDGYTFNGWASDESREISITGWSAKTKTGAQTIYSKGFTAKTYNIVYETYGGTNPPSNPSSYTIETPDITLLGASKEGYTFDAWYDKDGNKVETIEQGTFGDIYLYAGYNANKYTATFDLNEGVAKLKVNYICTNDASYNYTIDFDSSDDVGVYDYLPEKSNYLFSGWYTDPEFNNLVSEDIAVFSELNLYGKFIPNSQLTYTPLQVGENYVETFTLDYKGKTTSKKFICPSFLSATGTFKAYAASQKIDEWAYSLSDSYIRDENSKTTVVSAKSEYGDPYYDFDEQTYDLVPNNVYTLYTHGAGYDGYKGKLYGDSYAKIVTTVNPAKFVFNGVCAQTFDSQIIFPTIERSGYEFDGWYIGSEPYTPGIWKFTEDKTFTAHWK